MSQHFIPTPATSINAAVGGASAALATSLLPGKYYLVWANTDMWITQSVAGTTAVVGGAASMFVPAKMAVYLHGSNGAKVNTIQDSGPGKASCTLVALM